MNGSGVTVGHVFISYRHEDTDRVDLLQATLEHAGIRVWRDREALWPGDDWRIAIRRAISDGTLVFLACFSRRSLGRRQSWQNEELSVAVEQMRLRPPDEPWLIPVRFDDCDIPDIDISLGRSLRSIHRCDLFGKDVDDQAVRLVGAIRRILAAQTAPESSPQHELRQPRQPADLPAGAARDFREFLVSLNVSQGNSTYSALAVASRISERQIVRIFNAELPLPRWQQVEQLLRFGVKADNAQIRRCRDLYARVVLERDRQRPVADMEQKRIAVLQGGGYLETLRELYPQDQFPLLELFGSAAPICVFPAPEAQWRDVEAALGAPPYDYQVPGRLERDRRRWPPRFDPDSWDRYQKEVAGGETGKRWDGPTWALDRMHIGPDGSIKIDCVPGRYYRSLATSEFLDQELMHAHKGQEGKPVRLADMKGRAWLHKETGDSGSVVLDGHHREAAVSVAATIMIARPDGGYEAWLTPRSKDVATHRFFNHVIPSGIFQPLEPTGRVMSRKFVDTEFSVRRTFDREFIEELYAAEEFADPGPLVIPNPEDEPEIDRLSAEDQISLYYTGVSVNLLTLRPEICLLMLVTDPTWQVRESKRAKDSVPRGGRPMRYGWEVVQHERDLPDNRTLSRSLLLDAAFQPIETGSEDLQPHLLVPNAAAAIHLAIKVASARNR